MKLWILRHDFFCEETESVTLALALHRLKSFDWETELMREAEARSAGRDCCHPSLGFDDDESRSLQICPVGGGAASVNYRRKNTEEDSGEQWLEADDVPADVIERLIDLHFAVKESDILHILEKYGLPADKELPRN